MNTKLTFKNKLADLRHDLKTPIGHILGYSELLEEELEESPWDEFQVDLTNIHNSGEKLLNLIEDHLNANKQSVNEIDITTAQFQLRLQLNHITGYCELLNDLAEDEARHELTGDLNNILKASLTFAELLEAKLTLTYLESADKVEQSDESLETPEPVITSNLVLNELGQGGVVLVVDDDDSNLDLLSRRLKRQGYQPITLSSGKEALEYLSNNKVDIILLDLMMPEMSGTEVLTHLRNDPKHRNLPIIILSAHDDMDTIVKCILLGADDYLFKPYNPVLLKARIGATLEKYRLRSNQVPRVEVFISSPGDVIPERKVVRSVISDLNDELSDRVRITPVFWEDEPLLASDTFQAQIHPAKNSDIYIGIFWSRLGSPLPESITREDGSLYDSGSEYEFEDAYNGYADSGKPEILVYRKQAEAYFSLQETDKAIEAINQFEKVQRFMDKWFINPEDGSYKGAYHCFNAEHEFEEMISKHLKKLVLKHLEDI